MGKVLILALLFCSLYTTNAFPIDQYDISQNFTNFLEDIRRVIINGSSANNIPVLDPFHLDATTFKFQSKYLDFNLRASEISLTGLADFIFHDASIVLDPSPKVHYNFTLPFSILDTETYKFTGLLFKALPIYGSGSSYFEVGGLRIVGYSDIKTDSKGNVEFLNFSFKIYVDSLKSETNGMLGGGDIDLVINEMLTDLGPDFILFYSSQISQIATDSFLNDFNQLINGTTINDLINLLG